MQSCVLIIQPYKTAWTKPQDASFIVIYLVTALFLTLHIGGAGECLSWWQYPPVEPEAKNPCYPAFSQVQQGEVQ